MIRVLAFQSLNFPINKLSSIVLCLVLLFSQAEADTQGPNFPTLQDSTYQPSLAVVIAILAVTFVATVILIAYAKFCQGSARPSNGDRGQNRAAILGSSNRFSGIDKTVVESLPFFRFSSLKGSKEGLECSVCLSKFEDVEVLRLLPKCRHAFHIDCIDRWLEKHSSCPLCRRRVSSEDLKLVTNSNSMRFLWNSTSNVELFVRREDSRGGSSRFSVGNSFRNVEKSGVKDEESAIRNEAEEDRRRVHKLNNRIVVSGFAFNNRWSDLRSSDLAFLSSQMLNDTSNGRFSSVESSNEETETKNTTSNPVAISATSSRPAMNLGQQRSVSEIATLSRYASYGVNSGITVSSSSSNEESEKGERIRKVWLPIAKRTVQWFANKERSQSSQRTQTETIEEV